MFVTINQFYIFVACVAIGGISGIFFSVANFVNFLCKKSAINFFADFFAFMLTTLLFVFCAYKLNFPSIRFYMFIGVFVGIFLYNKSFNIILAKIAKKLYNKLVKKFNKIKMYFLLKHQSKNTKVKIKNDRKKVRKNNSCINGRGSIVGNDIVNNNGLSTNIHKRCKER